MRASDMAPVPGGHELFGEAVDIAVTGYQLMPPRAPPLTAITWPVT